MRSYVSWPRWLADDGTPGMKMTVCEITHFWFVRLCYRLWDVEWDEDWRQWPHCCTQAGCWMHVNSRVCRCKCWWCRVANDVIPWITCNILRIGEDR